MFYFIFSLDNKSAGRQSIASNLMKNDDEVDDGDSMAAYGEGDTGKVSFLHLYPLEMYQNTTNHHHGGKSNRKFDNQQKDISPAILKKKSSFVDFTIFCFVIFTFDSL